jgi:UDP-N-acetylmuramate dehydrogenase
VGGPADALVRVDTRDELVRACSRSVTSAASRSRAGGGFNCSCGQRVPAWWSRLRRFAHRASGDALVRAEAGVTHTQITRFCAERGRAGLEFAVGIPGTVGGWIAMNAGVHGAR